MATTQTDTLYAGLAHTAPPPCRESTIDSRWLEWLPWCTQFCRNHNLLLEALAPLRVTHRTRLVALLNAGIAWESIRRGRLDNPLSSEDAFQFQIRAAIERRRVRRRRKSV